jgi:hypothetical protein
MKHLRTIFLLLVLCLAVGAVSQAPSSSAPPAQQSPQPAPTVSSVVDRAISQIEKQFVDLADAMPEDKFNFTPESLNIKGSEYKGVRSFAFEVKHVATANYFFWSSATGDKLPEGIAGPNGPENLKTKAEIMKFLKDSFAVGHKAAAALTTENIVELLPFRNNKAPRLQLVMSPVPHAFDHYGQLVEYLRMNGIVPPASRGN